MDDLHAVLAITGTPGTYHYIPEKPMNERDARSMIEREQNHPECDDIPADGPLSSSKPANWLSYFHSARSATGSGLSK